MRRAATKEPVPIRLSGEVRAPQSSLTAGAKYERVVASANPAGTPKTENRGRKQKQE